MVLANPVKYLAGGCSPRAGGEGNGERSRPRRRESAELPVLLPVEVMADFERIVKLGVGRQIIDRELDEVVLVRVGANVAGINWLGEERALACDQARRQSFTHEPGLDQGGGRPDGARPRSAVDEGILNAELIEEKRVNIRQFLDGLTQRAAGAVA